MKTQTYTTRRSQSVSTTNWTRNRNTVRHTPKTLGSLSHAVIVGMLVLIVGLIYVAQGVKATDYDYENSNLREQISELEAKKEDLAVEKARATTIASVESSEVATSMEAATPSGYATE